MKKSYVINPILSQPEIVSKDLTKKYIASRYKYTKQIQSNDTRLQSFCPSRENRDGDISLKVIPNQDFE